MTEETNTALAPSGQGDNVAAHSVQPDRDERIERIRRAHRTGVYNVGEVVDYLLTTIDGQGEEVTRLSGSRAALESEVARLRQREKALSAALADYVDRAHNGFFKRVWRRLTKPRPAKRFLVGITDKSGGERYGHTVIPTRYLSRLYTELSAAPEVQEARVYREIYRTHKLLAGRAETDKLIGDIEERLRTDGTAKAAATVDVAPRTEPTA